MRNMDDMGNSQGNHNGLHNIARNRGSSRKSMRNSYGNNDNQDEPSSPVTARPRRLSEISIKKNKKPIPRGSSLFIFSYTNR